ncbi:MAG: sialidase family protein [Acidobacteria bacterium]|nr:sialidase family protein [Acidobacteriota bacterium]
MRIEACGILHRAEPGGRRAIATMPGLVRLPGGRLLATYRVGSTKNGPDETIEIRSSDDLGNTWSLPRLMAAPKLGGVTGTLSNAYLTVLPDGRLLAAGMWVDRESFRGKPLFNPETDGCLPMKIVVAESSDEGGTWTPWRLVPLPDHVGPASLTNPPFCYPGGTLAISIESNKTYNDASKWYQKVVHAVSRDGGRTWPELLEVSRDPSGRIFNWDQRGAVARDGRVITFTWTYDSELVRYRNIHRRISRDQGATWPEAEDLGFSDQPSHPAILPDGRVVLAWVDRYGSRSIRARLAESLDAPFLAETEEVLYEAAAAALSGSDTKEMLADMGNWNYGLPFAEVIGPDRVLVVHYAGTSQAMDIRWVRLAL